MEREKSLGWLCRMIVEKDIAKVVAGHRVMLWYDSLSVRGSLKSQARWGLGVGEGELLLCHQGNEIHLPMIGLGSPISPQQLSKQIQSLQPIKNRLSATLHTPHSTQPRLLPKRDASLTRGRLCCSGLRYGTDVRYLPSLTQG